MDTATLVSMLDFGRARLLGSLDAIEKSGEPIAEVLVWRPATNRAHIGWQALHCAATFDRYLNVMIKGHPAPSDPQLVERFGGGSTPADNGLPTLPVMRSILQQTFTPFRSYVASLDAGQLESLVGPPDRQRKLGDAVVLLAWHEAHHQGQLHLTWNMYRQAHGIV